MDAQEPSQAQAELRIPRFLVPQEPWLRGFFRRTKEYLVERPVKAPRGAAGGLFRLAGFGEGLLENLKEFFRPAPRVADRAQTRMLVAWTPWHRVLWENLRDAIIPPKLPPLQVTSKPVQVREIWTRNERYKWYQALSLVMHLALVGLLTAPIVNQLTQPTQAAKNDNLMEVDIGPYLLKLPPGNKPQGGGGGGERNPIPPTKGKIPKFFPRQLTPPLLTPRNPDPKLAAEPTLIGPPDIKVPQSTFPNYGDPLAKLITGSAGPGSGGGIGTGSGGGIGSGEGPGLGPGKGGGFGGGVYRPGIGGVGEPHCIFCPDPRYSEEARKAKYQGTVLLELIVTPDGKAANLRVIKGLGLGLDEKAMETVREWVFKPALGPGGKPVAVLIRVEVVFRLL